MSCRQTLTHDKPTAESVNQRSPQPAYKLVNGQLINDYHIFLTSLDTTAYESSTKAAKKYADIFKSQDQNTRDSAFFIFNEFYNKLDNALDDIEMKDTTMKYDSLLIDSSHQLPKLSPKLAAYYQKLNTNGFKIFMSEGDTYVGENLDFIAKWFYDYVSNPLRECLTQLNKEDKQGFEEDAGLTISPVQLADRTVWWESFAKKHPETIVEDEALVSWRDYLGTLLEGMDNTPITESGDIGGLNNYYKTAYKHIQKAYPTSKTNKLIAPYFRLRLQNNTSGADELLKEYIKKGFIRD